MSFSQLKRSEPCTQSVLCLDQSELTEGSRLILGSTGFPPSPHHLRSFSRVQQEVKEQDRDAGTQSFLLSSVRMSQLWYFLFKTFVSRENKKSFPFSCYKLKIIMLFLLIASYKHYLVDMYSNTLKPQLNDNTSLEVVYCIQKWYNLNMNNYKTPTKA